VLGWKAGVPVLLIDALKGWLAVNIVGILTLPFITEYQLINYQILLGIIVVVGHIFPLFAGFRGGKGVATLFGVGIALYPLSVLVVVAIFILILILTKYVSLGSIIGALSFPVVDIFIFQQDSLSLILLSIAVGIFIPITHRKNIKRLLRGEESKFYLRS
jgi:glycerol-3-phosphate acyltransferase PlsY